MNKRAAHTGCAGLRLCLTAALIAAAGACRRQDVPPPLDEAYSARVILSTNRVTVGDLVRMRLDFMHSPGDRIEFAEPSSTAALVVRDRHVSTQDIDAGHALSTYRYTLSSFTLGVHAAVTGTVRFVKADADSVERFLPEAYIEVASVIDEGDDELELRPVKAPLTWPERVSRRVAIAAAILLILLASVVSAARMLGKRRAAIPEPPPPPPHETALAALQRLMRRGYIESNQDDAFYTEISDIVRRYLEDKFELRAPESTTEEFIRAAAGTRVLRTEHQALVREFLEQSDLVKFARFRPGAPEMRDAFSAAERLIRETIHRTATSEGIS